MLGKLRFEEILLPFSLIESTDLHESVVECPSDCILEGEELCPTFSVGSGCIGEFPVKFGGS